MAKVHRLGDTCAIYLGTGETIYMSVKETRALVQALNKVACSIGGESFRDSTGNSFEIGISSADNPPLE